MASKPKVHKFVKQSSLHSMTAVSSSTLPSFASDFLPFTKHFQPVLGLSAVE